jgi:DNA invertase Pin-like site-specific DNA recombinase
MPRKNDRRVAVYFRVGYEPTTALYCRTATQDSFAIQNQKDRLLRYAEENDHTNLSWYIDNGESGTTLNRPAMKQLIADIKSGRIETVLVISADRVARGIAPMSEWVRLIKERNVRCIAAETGEEGLSNEFSFWLDVTRSLCPELFAWRELGRVDRVI